MLRADTYRLLRSRGMYAFYLLIIFTFAIDVLVKAPVGFLTAYDQTAVTAGLKLDLQTIGFNFNYYYLLLIPTSVILLSDFGEGTIKNTLSSVTTKTKYFVFKWIFLQVISLISFTCGNSLYYIFNRIILGKQYSSQPSEFFSVLFMQIPGIMTIMSTFVLLAFFVRRTAVFCVIALIVPSVYSIVLGVLDGFDATRSFAEEYLMRLDFSNSFQDIAGGIDPEFSLRLVIAFIIITIGLFIAGLRMYNRAEAVNR